MKVLIKPRPEIKDLLSRENVKNAYRQLIEPNVDLIFYNDIKKEEREDAIKEIDILIGPKIDEKELNSYTKLKMHQTFATGLEMFNFEFYKKK
ncbi:MAG: hypothetical protein R3255_07590 [Candidatus Lokiarchaeia archaeon]|nr:hypothetical protein [Candidatus Lokiarchaeia archaeon]